MLSPVRRDTCGATNGFNFRSFQLNSDTFNMIMAKITWNYNWNRRQKMNYEKFHTSNSHLNAKFIPAIMTFWHWKHRKKFGRISSHEWSSILRNESKTETKIIFLGVFFSDFWWASSSLNCEGRVHCLRLFFDVTETFRALISSSIALCQQVVLFSFSFFVELLKWRRGRYRIRFQSTISDFDCLIF